MLSARIIPCLDVHAGRVVKGVKFAELRDAGDPVAVAAAYEQQGADELVFLDITASSDERRTMVDVVERTADKVSLNTSAIKDPALVKEAARKFGSQCIVVAIDAKNVGPGRWEVFTHGGRNPTGLDAVEWARRAHSLGAGEILLTSMDRDGTAAGYDIPLNAAVSAAVEVPVIASGGAGNLDHLADVLKHGGASAVLAASIFHFGTYTVRQAKEHLRAAGLPVRL